MLVSFFILCVSILFLSDCSRKKENKKSPYFQIRVPLEEEYPLLKRGLISVLELSFPKPNLSIEEGLSDKYEIPPFEDWITRADPDFFLKLEIKAERSEEIPHLIAFLNREEMKPPFKFKVPKSEVVGSEFRGESVLCRMEFEGRDILSKQVCKVLQQSLCFKELRPQAKRFAGLSPASCELIIPEIEKNELAQNKNPKSFVLTAFPLPLRVRGDYPFSRFAEVDENLLLTLFGP